MQAHVLQREGHSAVPCGLTQVLVFGCEGFFLGRERSLTLM